MRIEQLQTLIMCMIGILRDYAQLVRTAPYLVRRGTEAEKCRTYAKFLIAELQAMEDQFVTATETHCEKILSQMVSSEKSLKMLQERFDDDEHIGVLVRMVRTMREQITPNLGIAEAEVTTEVRVTFRQYREELEKILAFLGGA